MSLRIFITFLIGLTLFVCQSVFVNSNVFAHVEITQPQLDEVLQANTMYTIKWATGSGEVKADSSFDIRFSSDNGTTWEIVVEGLDIEARDFEWKVANVNSEQCIIEVKEDRISPIGHGAQGRSAVFTIEKTKPFSFNCQKEFNEWVLGIEKLNMDVGDVQECVLKLGQPKAGEQVKIAYSLRKWGKASIELSPNIMKTDENGELRIFISAIAEGIDWVAWAIPDSKGKFRFNKNAYDEGSAWGMFVEAR